MATRTPAPGAVQPGAPPPDHRHQLLAALPGRHCRGRRRADAVGSRSHGHTSGGLLGMAGTARSRSHRAVEPGPLLEANRRPAPGAWPRAQRAASRAGSPSRTSDPPAGAPDPTRPGQHRRRQRLAQRRAPASSRQPRRCSSSPSCPRSASSRPRRRGPAPIRPRRPPAAIPVAAAPLGRRRALQPIADPRQPALRHRAGVVEAALAALAWTRLAAAARRRHPALPGQGPPADAACGSRGPSPRPRAAARGWRPAAAGWPAAGSRSPSSSTPPATVLTASRPATAPSRRPPPPPGRGRPPRTSARAGVARRGRGACWRAPAARTHPRQAPPTLHSRRCARISMVPSPPGTGLSITGASRNPSRAARGELERPRAQRPRAPPRRAPSRAGSSNCGLTSTTPSAPDAGGRPARAAWCAPRRS